MLVTKLGKRRCWRESVLALLFDTSCIRSVSRKPTWCCPFILCRRPEKDHANNHPGLIAYSKVRQEREREFSSKSQLLIWQQKRGHVRRWQLGRCMDYYGNETSQPQSHRLVQPAYPRSVFWSGVLAILEALTDHARNSVVSSACMAL